MARNKNMHDAKKNKNDEFYTQLSDIENELKHYRQHFKNKTVFLNCDDPKESNFWRYFSLNFEFLGLKKLVSTHFDVNKPTYKLELLKYNTKPILTPLKQNGDFRSDECVEILRECDIVVTNPPFSCYSDDTEVLTSNGWKLFDDVEENDLICSLNTVNDNIEYVKYKAKIKNLHDGTLLNFKTRNMDFMVTDNHRMISRGFNRKKNIIDDTVGERLILAKDIKSGYTLPLRGFNYEKNANNDISNIILPKTIQKEQYSRKEIIIGEKVINIDYWLDFFGMWIADGCVRFSKNSNGDNRYVVSIKQNKSNDALIKKLYNNIGFPCKVYKNKSGNHNYEVYSKQLFEYLKVFGKSKDKYIPKNILMMSKDRLKRLWESYLKGDSFGNDKQFVFSTISKQLADDLSEICLKVEGRIVNCIKRKTMYNGREYNYYKASYSKTNISRFFAKYPKPIDVEYSGFVHCLELEKNGTMLVRRNGIQGWSGNCFREFIGLLVENNKKFIAMGNNNAITYKEVFSLIKDNKVWLGVNNNKTMSFRLPDEYEKYNEIDENGNKIGKVPAISWFTNLEHNKRNEELLLYKKYYDDPTLYPKYDNYDAIEVSRVKDIPMDYYGVMGVPITFMDKFNPKQFEIMGICNSARWIFFKCISKINGKNIYNRIIIKRKQQ